ncbi:MAG TPA: lipopolysaccharide kinase InaA family protein [Terriglobia bacterium]|nr:lipopolysaccharide kinase InaA family protein [Terriglobia bacterium]
MGTDMSSHNFGCFYCSGISTDATGVCPDCGRPIDVGSLLLRREIEGYRTLEVLGRGFYGWTVKAEDPYLPFSLKLIPAHRLEPIPSNDQEARSLAACSPHRNIAQFFRRFPASIQMGKETVPVVVLVFEFVKDAQPLSKLLLDNTVSLSRKDVQDILMGIASGIARMHSVGIWHDDLHDGNIVIRRVADDENLPEQYEAKLIDFGSTKPIRLDEPEHGDRGDYHYLAKHIYALTNRFESDVREKITPADRAFAGRLRRLAQRIDDPDISRRNLGPADIKDGLRRAHEESATGYEFPTFAEMKERSSVSFDEPLQNTNALNLAPQDIALLFRDALNWQTRFEKTETVIILGPRGCGKTMLLRYLSTQSQARSRKDENTSEDVRRRLEGQSYIGFIVSAGQLRTPFFRSSYKKLEEADAHRAEEFCREFISSVFVLEIVRTVLWLKAEGLAQISVDDLDILASTVLDLLSEVPKEVSGNGKATKLEDLLEIVERQIRFLSNMRTPEQYSPSMLSRDDALELVGRALQKSSWVHTRQIWFLLDDYSVTVLPAFVQRSYNSVLFNLPHTFRLKVSSEGEGPVLDDHLQRKYKEGRELTNVNLGEVYFSASEKEGRTFFEQILDARFKEVGKGSLRDVHTILSEHKHLQGFGEYICAQKRPGLAQFYGFGLLCHLCSGDVSFIIELLHTLVEGHWGKAVKPLSPASQDHIIKYYAQRQLADLKRITEHGAALYMFAERVGSLLKQYLLASCNKGDPDERPRIEIEGPEALSMAAQETHDCLLRHSVLIEGGTGKSRSGLPTKKLYFRRLFAPCFPFSPSRKGCIALTVPQYEKWLIAPGQIPKAPITPKREKDLFE